MYMQLKFRISVSGCVVRIQRENTALLPSSRFAGGILSVQLTGFVILAKFLNLQSVHEVLTTCRTNHQCWPVMWDMLLTPALGRLRPEDHEFETSVDYVVRSCF